MRESKKRVLPGALVLAGLVLAGAACAGAGRGVGAAPTRNAASDSKRQKQARSAYGRLPLGFEANVGQTDPRVKFLSRGPGGAVWLTGSGAVMQMRGFAPRPRDKTCGLRRGKLPGGATRSAERATLRMKLVGSNPNTRVEGAESLPGKANYFIGSDPSRWHAGVPTYAKVRYAGVYPGTDLVYYGRQGQLEYDFVLQPGADPARVQLRFEGARGMKTEARGDLLMRVGSLTARHQQPVAYQEADGVRKQVPVRYRLLAENRIGFQLGAYDRNRPLVIDPVIKYSTYLGGSAGDEGEDIAVDTDGAAYVTGDTDSTNFPTQGPFQSDKPGTDAFVSKLNAAGTALLYSTYLGGLGSDFGLAIAVGSSKSAFVTGITDSRDFPTTVGAFDRSFGGPTTFDPDAFVTKLNATGNILTYSTFLGGTASEAGFGIALDGQEQAFVTGNTYSTNFPTAGAFQNAPGDVDPNVPDAFVTKLNAAGSGLVFSTYLGGNDYDEGDDIAVDSLGRAVVTGVTFATNFPTTATRFQGDQPNADAFVTQFTAAGNSLSYSTYLGGSDSESALGVGIGPQDKIFVTGGTKSTDFPVKGPFQNNKPGMDAYVAKLDADASGAASLLYSTYLGGSADDQGTDIAVDGAGGAYVTGWTQSSDFPTKSPVQAALNGSQDAFATRLNVPGNGAVWSTFLGGSLSDQGNGIAVDPKGSVSAQSGSAYLTGVTSSVNFPTVTPIMTDPGDNATDAFVTKLRATLILRPFPLFASAFSATSIRLAWDDKSDTETGFEIFRAVGTGDFAFLARVGENAQTFVDNGLTPGQTYRYMVRAFNDEGQSDFSNEASAKPGRRLTAKLQVTPGRLSFGTVRVGRTKLVRLKLKNIGSAPLFVIVDGVDAPFTLSGLPAEGFTLARGRSRTVSVRFTPTAAGTFRDSAIVRIIGPSPAMRAIPLSGKATGAPAPQ